MSNISNGLKEKIRIQAKKRWGYCLITQEICPLPLEIEHIIPQSEEGSDEEDNLWLACRVCNGYKHAKIEALDDKSGKKVKIFNPRKQNWKKHFEFSKDKTKIVGKTAIGRATVKALKINNELAVAVSEKWTEIGWYPPND